MFETAFTYHFKQVNETQFLCIVDGNQGMSVTNNIEGVVKKIADEEQINPADYIIIYQDTSGMWDGWDDNDQDFFFLGAHNERQAIEKYFKLKNIA